MRSLFQPRHIEDLKILLQAIKDQGWDDINWAAYIRADNIDLENCSAYGGYWYELF